jgi:hypothetical protein
MHICAVLYVWVGRILAICNICDLYSQVLSDLLVSWDQAKKDQVVIKIDQTAICASHWRFTAFCDIVTQVSRLSNDIN